MVRSVNRFRRDTVNIGLAGDDVTIRFVVSPLRVFSSSSSLSVVCHMSSRTLQTDNPGPWFLHCHIDFHLVAGLAIVFAEDAPDVAHVNPVPGALVACSMNSPLASLTSPRCVTEAWKELCPKYDATLNHKRMGEL